VISRGVLHTTEKSDSAEWEGKKSPQHTKSWIKKSRLKMMLIIFVSTLKVWSTDNFLQRIKPLMQLITGTIYGKVLKESGMRLALYHHHYSIMLQLWSRFWLTGRLPWYIIHPLFFDVAIFSSQNQIFSENWALCFTI